MTFTLPKWVWIGLIIVGVIVLCVIFKFNVSGHIGTSGVGAEATQGLVH